MPFSPGYPLVSTQKRTYSLLWADSVVQKLREKHPRGLKAWEQETGIFQSKLAMILARNEGEWHHIRRCIALLDTQLGLLDKLERKTPLMEKAITIHTLVNLLKNGGSALKKTFQLWLVGLTEQKMEQILEEPGEKGGTERSESDDRSLPSLLSGDRSYLDGLRNRKA